MNKFKIAFDLIRIAKQLVGKHKHTPVKDDVPGVSHLRKNSKGQIIAYHGSTRKFSSLKAHTSRAYEDKGNLIFLTQYFGDAVGFAFNGDDMYNWLKDRINKDNFYFNFEHSMNFKDWRKKIKFEDVIGQPIDIYVEIEDDIDMSDGNKIKKDIYVYEVDIAPYIDNVKDINHGSDFEFVIEGIDEIPILKTHKLTVEYRIHKSFRTVCHKIDKFIENNFDKLKKCGHNEYCFEKDEIKYGSLCFDAKADKSEISFWIECYQSAVKNAKSAKLYQGNDKKFSSYDRFANWLLKNKKDIMDVLMGFKLP